MKETVPAESFARVFSGSGLASVPSGCSGIESDRSWGDGQDEKRCGSAGRALNVWNVNSRLRFPARDNPCPGLLLSDPAKPIVEEGSRVPAAAAFLSQGRSANSVDCQE